VQLFLQPLLSYLFLPFSFKYKAKVLNNRLVLIITDLLHLHRYGGVN
jgi:hypothetical protein